MVAGGPEGSGRALRLDPFALPVRFSAQDGGADGQIRQVELGRERVVLRRAVRGIPMNVGVPVAAFRGVSLRLMPAEGTQLPSVAVVLDHRDSALCVPLFVATDGDDGIAIWKSWGRVLGLPLLVIDHDGAMREPFPRLGGVGIGAPSPRRRRRAALKWRRPSILMRRKPGRPPVIPIVRRGEREIIARN
jgi:Family of unknown function (DUF6101)